MSENDNMVLQRSARAIARFKRLPRIDIWSKDGGVSFGFDVDRLAYSDFDRAGIVSLYAIGKHIELQRLLSKQKSLAIIKPRPGLTPVMHSQIFHITKSFYNNTGIIYPMAFKSEPGYLGTSRFSQVASLTDKRTNELLLTNEWQTIYIDNNTREKVPLLKVGIDPKYFQTTKPFQIETAKAPENCYQVERRVQYSDYDFLQHVNTLSYARWCLDVAAEASIAGTLNHFQGDIAEYPVERAEIVHYDECFVPDTVRISMWPCDKKPRALLFQVDRVLKTDIRKAAFLRISFYPFDDIEMRSKL